MTQARKELAMDFHSKQETTSPFIDTPDYTFTLPDLSIHEEEFRRFLEKDLIECATLNSLENCQRLNWWVDIGLCRKIWPLSTSGVSKSFSSLKHFYDALYFRTAIVCSMQHH